MSVDSLKKRYSYKLLANLGGYAIGLISAGIIPRGLGPKAYGDFNFLTSFFTQAVGFFDMSSSTAFFTKVSQRQRETGLIVFYSRYILLVAGVLFVLVSAARMCGLNTRLWPGQQTVFVYCAVLWALLNWLLNIGNQLTDAFGLTVKAETWKLCQKVFSVLAILGLYTAHAITLGTFFVYQYGLFIFILSVYGLLVARSGYVSIPSWTLTRERIGTYAREFITYCHPLFWYSLLSLVTAVFDRWILQVFGGSVQQGFFGLSYQIGAMCFLFAGAMTPLFMRELSVASGTGDREQMRHLFRRYIPLLYSITAYFSCFASVQADSLIFLFGGRAFQGASVAVALMALFPLHQTYGQLSGSVFLVTGQTKLYSKMGSISMIAGLPMTYLLIAPHSRFGLDAGATGLAVKMLVANILLVNVQLYFNARFLGLSFRRYLWHQVGIVGMLIGCAFLSRALCGSLPWGKHVIVGFLMSGMVYTACAAALFFRYPRIFGLKREDIGFLGEKIRSGLGRGA